MNTPVFITDLFNALCEVLTVKPQACAHTLNMSVPAGVDLTKPLNQESYLLWRDKYVHDFWMDRDWLVRDQIFPVEAIKQAHQQMLSRSAELA